MGGYSAPVPVSLRECRVSFAVGSLVTARGRDWVVLPDSEQDFLILRPLGGTDEEVTGIHVGLEQVQAAALPVPSATDHTTSSS